MRDPFAALLEFGLRSMLLHSYTNEFLRKISPIKAASTIRVGSAANITALRGTMA